MSPQLGGKMTRVDGKGLWRSWKRNFTTKLLALLDLIDNSLDAAIQGQNDDDGDHNSFTGRLHVYPDVYQVPRGPAAASSTTTGLCIVNNCINTIRPLEKVLEVYNSSKVDSGAGDIGENGVGLKQGCATLSDLSFVLVKNGSDENIELGIVAKDLQREEGCYLPAFKFSNKKGKGSPSLKDQMMRLFSQPHHADVVSCIAQYGAASFGSDPNLVVGVERLCGHFDRICHNFFNDPHVFLVILDKVHHGQSEEYVQNAWDAQQKITVNRLMKDLGNDIPRTYLHIPSSFDFMIGDKKAEFKYWPQRLVELTSFTVNINPKISWQHKFDPTVHPDSYELRVFVGFDGLRITDPNAGKEPSLFVHSRQSGRLIKHHPDARTILRLTASGSTYCQGLTIIIDDIRGNLPLNPTKQSVAFGEEAHGAIHEENLMAWVGGVAHFFYNFHFKKFQELKRALTQKIASFGDVLLKKNRQTKTLDSSDLTTYHLSFKKIDKYIRADKSSAQEIVGSDTLYRLSAERSRTASASKKGTNGRKRKATSANNNVTRPSKSLKIPRRRQPDSYREAEAELESDRETKEGDMEEVDGSDDNYPPTQPAAKIQPRRRQPVSSREAESDREMDEVDDNDDSDHPTQPAVNSRPSKERLISRRESENEEAASEADVGEIGEDHPAQPTANHNAAAEQMNDDDECTEEDYKGLCGRLTLKTITQKAEINTQKAEIELLRDELAEEKTLRQTMQQQMRDELAEEKALHQTMQQQIQSMQMMIPVDDMPMMAMYKSNKKATKKSEGGDQDPQSKINSSCAASSKPTPQKGSKSSPRKGHPTVGNDSHISSEPVEEFPAGWVTRKVPRSAKGSKALDKFHYSPKLQYRFRSKPEVRRFLALLKTSGGDEAVAIRKLKR